MLISALSAIFTYIAPLQSSDQTKYNTSNVTFHPYTPEPIQNIPWTRLTSDTGWGVKSEFKSVVTPDGSIVVVGGKSGDLSYSKDVWCSHDRGKTWAIMTPNASWSLRVSFSLVSLADNSILLLGGLDVSNNNQTYLNDVWKSSDYGANWEKATNISEWSPRVDTSVLLTPDNYLILIGGYDGENYLNDVWISKDKGTHWSLLTSFAEWSPRSDPVLFNTQDGQYLLIGGFNSNLGINDIWESKNGVNWNRIKDTDSFSYQTVSNHKGSYYQIRAEVYESKDNCLNWKQISGKPEWYPRSSYQCLYLPDNSIIELSGTYAKGKNPIYNEPEHKNDIWKLQL